MQSAVRFWRDADDVPRADADLGWRPVALFFEDVVRSDNALTEWLLGTLDAIVAKCEPAGGQIAVIGSTLSIDEQLTEVTYNSDDPSCVLLTADFRILLIRWLALLSGSQGEAEPAAAPDPAT